MKPYPHQIAKANEAYQILAENMIVYLAMEERTGKTLTSILVCEQAKVDKILVITKKKAVPGWFETLAKFKPTKGYTITNYHQAKKFENEYDLIVLDEAHSYISSFPKTSKIWESVAKLTKGRPIIYLSATPYAQGPQLLYNQFALSDWSPFKKWKTAYSWFRSFGIPETIYLSGRQVETYKNVRAEEVLAYCNHLFVTGTRQELGHDHEPTDKVHYIELTDRTKEVYNALLKLKALEINGVEIELDTKTKVRTMLHQLEGGTLKVGPTEYMQLGNTEKIDYLKSLNLSEEDLVIMYNYKAEKEKLETAFPNALVLQATSYAEGVDLSHKKHLVIYSQDFSTARHSQRRARQANKEREEPIIVHYLLVKDAISDQVYKTVSLNKQNFIDSVFEEKTL